MPPDIYATRLLLFCKCGWIMEEPMENVAECVNPKCPERGKEYDVVTTLTERKRFARETGNNTVSNQVQ